MKTLTILIKGGLELRDKSGITILTGHFGSGKTEIAINLAFMEKARHKKVAIADLDVINPYYRTRDVSGSFKEAEIELIAPVERLASSDLPIVSGEIYRVLHNPEYRIIVDAGGDKDGAIALGQYFNDWKDKNPETLFVLNANRPYVSTAEGVLQTIEQIEAASRLKIAGIINNTNVGSETTMEDIWKGDKLSREVSALLDLPVLFTAISMDLKDEAENFRQKRETIFIERHMKLPWEA